MNDTNLEPYEREILEAMAKLMLATMNADAAIRLAREEFPGLRPNPHTKHPRKYGKLAASALELLRHGMELSGPLGSKIR